MRPKSQIQEEVTVGNDREADHEEDREEAHGGLQVAREVDHGGEDHEDVQADLQVARDGEKEICQSRGTLASSSLVVPVDLRHAQEEVLEVP
jgi:hypothetical protein